MDLKLKDNSQLTLPTEYFPVEYVESSGYPNINTGFSISMYNNSTFKIDAIIEVIDNIESSPAIYNAVGLYRRVSLVCDNSITNFLAYAGTFTSSQSPASVEFSGKVHIIHTQGKITINDVTTTVPYSSVNASGTLSLLTQSSKVRIWSFNCYTGNTLVRNYIPAVSYQEGHFGEACLYDKVNGVFYYSSSTGSFTASPSQGLYDIITSAYIKDCPNVSGINILRSCINLNKVRLDIGIQSETVAELYKYSAYAGFNDAYENQTKPRLVGTWTISDYWTNDELAYLQSAFDGLAISYDSEKNIDTLLENNDFAVQTFDSTKQGYNPAAAIILQSGDLGITSVLPLNDGGRFGFLKNDSTTVLPAIFRDKTTVVDSNKIVSNDDTEEYAFTSFDEFKEMTNITSIAENAFRGASNLTSIKLPNTVTSIGNSAFRMCTSLKDLYIPCNISLSALSGNENVSDYSGDGTGTLTIKGNIPGGSSWGAIINFRDIIIYGNVTCGNARIVRPKSRANSFRVKGDMTLNSGSNVCIFNGTTNAVGAFTEVMGDISCTKVLFSTNYYANTVTVFHCGYNQMVTATPTQMSIAKIAKVYVGQGISKSADETLLATYLADTNWSAQSAKLATWYDYNGEYKWYYITDNLTNCTNTNPDEWPHITRGESYETTIVADEGMTINSVTVEMLDTDTTSPTYDTYVDITSTLDIGTNPEHTENLIHIPSVTGNVKITASAS